MTAIWEGELIAQSKDNSDVEIPGLEFGAQVNVGRSEIAVHTSTHGGNVPGPTVYVLNSEGSARIQIFFCGKEVTCFETVMNDGTELQERRELAAQLAGLHLLQTVYDRLGARFAGMDVADLMTEYFKREIVGPVPIEDILTDGGEFKPLNSAEIDDLCERLKHGGG
jgi:hypothetical protein